MGLLVGRISRVYVFVLCFFPLEHTHNRDSQRQCNSDTDLARSAGMSMKGRELSEAVGIVIAIFLLTGMIWALLAAQALR